MGNGALSELLQAENNRTFNTLWVLGAEEGSFACECGDTDCRTYGVRAHRVCRSRGRTRAPRLRARDRRGSAVVLLNL